MKNNRMKNQVKYLYLNTFFEAFELAGASWVALLALRGFSLTDIGILEAIFHAVSLCGEIPSGVIADVLGRKNTMIASRIMCIVSEILMVVSNSFATIAVAIGMCALSYNLASGTREALAYDSLKLLGREDFYEKYASNDMMIYTFFKSTATLCAGLALFVGYKIAYSIDIGLSLLCLIVIFLITDVNGYKDDNKMTIGEKFRDCIVKSASFLKNNHKAVWLIAVNSLIGAFSTLLLFFLQAKLTVYGLTNSMLGPALFIMGLGATVGSKVISYMGKKKYSNILTVSVVGIILALLSIITKNPYIIVVGGFIGAFADNFLQVRTDVVLNKMIPSEQRATLISVCSFAFSVVMIVLSPVMGYVLDLM